MVTTGAMRVMSAVGSILSQDDASASGSAGRFAATLQSPPSRNPAFLRIWSKGLGFKGRVSRVQEFGGLGSSLWSQARAGGGSGYAFAEPSVTVGEVEKYEKHLTGQETVAEYLEAAGVDTTNLDGLELPSSLAVVQERLQFLLQIGLTIDDINDYPLMLGCSVKKNLIPVLSYLESLGVTTKALPTLVRRHPQILHSSVVVDLQPIVQYLEGLGIMREDMGSVLTRYPDVFGFKIEGTMSTSTAYLVMIGVNPRKMGAVLTQAPQILGMRVGNNIKPKVDFLVGLGVPRPAVAKMVEARPAILGLSLAEQMRPAVNRLLEAGVPRDAVARVLMQFPEVLGLNVAAKLAEKLPWLTAGVGVRREDLGEVLVKLPQLLVINVKMGTTRVEFLRQAGFAAADLGAMATKAPQLLAASVEQTLKPNLEFLTQTMGRPLDEVAEFPACLLYNLEARLRPRHEAAAARSMQCSLTWMFNCADDVFQQRLVGDYVSEEAHDEEADVPYIVARRTRLTDEGEEALDSPETESDDDDKDNDDRGEREI